MYRWGKLIAQKGVRHTGIVLLNDISQILRKDEISNKMSHF